MRILFFNYEYPPLGAGAGNASYYILKEYAKIPDLEVDFITSSIDSQYHLEETRNDNIRTCIRVHKLPIGKNPENLHAQSRKDLIIYPWRAFWFARKLIKLSGKKNEKYDLTHSFFTVPCGFISMLLKWEYKLPYIISLRGSDVPGYSDRFRFLYFFIRPIIRTIWKQAVQVIANSEGLKELAFQTNPHQAVGIIYNGVNTEDFKVATLNEKDDFIITNGGTRVTHRKGLNYLVEAVKNLLPSYPNIKLKIIGEGNAKDELVELAEKLEIVSSVEFLGRVPHEKIGKYYEEADVFVMPSLNEGMSNAMLEALASGLPIITTDTGGAKELVSDNKNGFFIKMKNSNDIAEKIEKLIKEPGLHKDMGAQSRKRAEEMSWKNAAEKYYQIYNEACHEN